MATIKILQEDDFSLEFRVENGLGSTGREPGAERSLQSDEYVLQERIIIPPHLSGRFLDHSLQSTAPLRANPPLIFIGDPELPVQYASIVGRAHNPKTAIEKRDSVVVMRTGGMNLLFSAPILCLSDLEFESAFARIGELLADCRMDETAIARTWLFMEDILRDYDKLNRARDNFFKTWFTLSNPLIPASTGIQGRIKDNRVLSIDFTAFSGECLTIRQLSSPLQNEPIDYGKLFSRAVQVRLPKNDLIWISGTASIDKTGASVYLGDFPRQLVFTLQVLSALLNQVGGDFSNVAQAIVYLKHGQDLDECLGLLDEAGFPRGSALFQLDVDVCRDDLLCEIEIAAVIPRPEA